MKNIKIGYEIKTGEEIKILPKHLVVTGITQESGKTTTLEALIKRSECQAIVFKTKPGEMGFLEGSVIPPYYEERSDWEYILNILEATMKEKLKFQRPWIIDLCRNTSNPIEVKKKIDTALAEGTVKGIHKGVYTELQAFFDKVLPELQGAKTLFSSTLDLVPGINIMELERFSDPVQFLVMQSVIDNVLKHKKKVIVLIPEAWKVAPQGRKTPCTESIGQFIRQGATKENLMWFDSQDITNMDKMPLKQVSTWILGKQMERNEVIRTLEQVPTPKQMRPKPSDIMRLSIGEFYVCTSEFVKKVYVQPSWLDNEKAKQIALGELKVSDLSKPKKLVPFARKLIEQKTEAVKEHSELVVQLRKDMVEMRHDFFNANQEIRTILQNQGLEIINLKARKVEINEEELISKIMQKSLSTPTSGAQIDEETLIKKILARVPSGEMKVYEVAPLEKIKKDFLEEAKNRILSNVNTLDDEQRKILKFIESRDSRVVVPDILEHCFGMTRSSGSRTKISQKVDGMASLELVRKDRGFIYKNLSNTIKNHLGYHSATEAEIQQIYDHILMEVIG